MKSVCVSHALHAYSSYLVRDVHFRHAVCRSGFDHQLNFTRALHQSVHICCLVDRAPYGLSIVNSIHFASIGASQVLTSKPWLRKIMPFPFGPSEAARRSPSSSLKTTPPKS